MMIPIVAASPMRGDATVIAKMMSTESAPPVHSHTGCGHVGETPKALFRDEQEREPDHDRHDAGEGERGEDSYAPAQLAHHRRLNGAREARGHRERDGSPLTQPTLRLQAWEPLGHSGTS
jgi:hypothetical protein